jgi:hypothetical protein
MTLDSKIVLTATLNQSNALDLGSRAGALTLARRYGFGDGTAANQADRLFTDTRTITASSNDDLDLAGVLTDAFGATLTFARVRGLIVAAAAGNTNNVVVGGAASNAFATPFGDPTDKLVVRPGATFALIAPDITAYAVTAATGDILRIANSGAGTSVTYDIVIIGASA